MVNKENDELKNRRYIQKIIVGVMGSMVLVVGIIAIPYPGPGWLIVFAGLAILAREFTWAERALIYGRAKYDEWSMWVKNQHWPVRALIFVFTAIIVVVTIWLFNGYGLINSWLDLKLNWLNSPIIHS